MRRGHDTKSRWACVLTLVTLAACAFDLPEPKDGESNAATADGGRADSSNGSTGEGGSSGNRDGGSSGVSSSSSSGTTGTVDGVDCTHVLLCSNFETEAADTVFPDHAASVASTTASQDHAVSGTTSVLVVTPLINGAQQQQMGRSRTFELGEKRKTIRYEMSVWIDKRSSTVGGFGVFGSIFVANPPNKQLATRITFDGSGSVRMNQAVYPESGAPRFSGIDIVFPIGRWVRVERELDLAAKTITLVLDGDKSNKTVFALDDAFALTQTVEFFLGFEYISGPTDTNRVYIDDVVLDAF